MAERQFNEPHTIGEARARKRILERDIMNIERQLAEPVRYDNDRVLDIEEYRRWRSKAHSSMVFKKTEHAFLKDWIVERRRRVNADEVGIFEADDPREVLVKTRLALKKALDGDDSALGAIYNVIDQFLQHAA
jgi:hypothetical protein